jgi:histidinol-phosphate phosphatase family protein
MNNPKRTLILDRDGILNKFEPGKYVTSVLNFHFCEGVLESVLDLAKCFDYIIVITNQAGVGKGLMSVGALRNIHSYMLEIIRANGGRIDGLYACTSENSPDRKPLLGMTVMAKKDFPEIDFEHAFVLGDSLSDMEFSRNLGAIPVGIGPQIFPEWVELRFNSLRDFTNWYLIRGVTS